MEDAKQLILAGSDLRDIEAVFGADIDIAVGEENDFEINIRRSTWTEDYTFGNVLYIKDTEYGGVIGQVNTDTSLDTIALCGRTWRGILDKKVIRPEPGEDYKIVSGELNDILYKLIAEQKLESVFSVAMNDTGIGVGAYQFDRYCTLLSGIEKMLKYAGHRLRIRYRQQERGKPGYVELAAVPIVDYSAEIELSQDCRLNFSFNNIRNGVNHLICLGKGELQERQVIDLYVQEDGSIGDTPFYTGVNDVTQTYEDTSTETDELREKGIEKLKELMNSSKFEMDVESLDLDVEIGDIVGGRDYLTGLSAKKPITRKIYKVTDGKTSTEYKIEGDDA